MTEKQFLLAYDRRRTSTLTLDSEPGAHTGTTRQYIPGYSDSNIVFLDTVSGNDANSGATELLAKLTYASAATAAGSAKKIRVINNGASLSTNITKPTEMKRGVSGTISSSLTAPVDTFTQSATQVITSSNLRASVWLPWCSRYVQSSENGSIAYSSDGDTWVSVTSFTSSSINAFAYSDELGIVVAVGQSDSVGYSYNGIDWFDGTITAHPNVSAYCGACWSKADSKFIIVGTRGQIQTSSDGITWNNVISNGNISWYDILYDAVNNMYVLSAINDPQGSSNEVLIYYGQNIEALTLSSLSGVTSKTLARLSHSNYLAKYVLVTNGGGIYYSADAITWSAAGTPSFSGSNVLCITDCPELGLFIAGGENGKIAYSFDGNTWVQCSSPSFSSTEIRTISWSPLRSKFIACGGGKSAISTAFANTISANVAGFTIQAVQYSGTITAYNCTMKQPGTTANLSLNACRITEAGSHISSNTATSFATLFDAGGRHTTCTPAAQNDIDCNLDTVGGKWYIYNASETGFERIRDCLVTGGIIANFNVTVTGRANIQGDSENILIDAEVTTDDPKFVDTTDYKLQFQTNGYPRNSLAAGRSAIYFNSAGDPRDIGAWSYVESAVSYYFAKSAVLYKGEITHEIEEAISEQQGDSGVVSVYGNTNRIKEILTITYGSTKEEDRAFLDYMRSLKDKGVKLILDAEWESNAGIVTVNGNQSAGVEFLTVDSTTYFNGLWITVSGKRYWVMRASPSNSAATKLILDRPLEDAVTDNQILVTNYPPGVGEYQFSPQSRLTLKRAAPDGLTGWQSGLILRFVRKYQ